MSESLKNRLIFLVNKNILGTFAAMIILVSAFFNIFTSLWLGVTIYLLDIILKNYILKINRKKKNKLKKGKIIDFDFIDKKIK